MKTIAQRMQTASQQYFAGLNAQIAELEAAGRDIIRLDIGSPDMPPAAAIVEALSHSASMHDHHGYQSHQGPAALRLAWAGMYHRVYGVEVDSESEILPLLGAKEGIFHLSQAILDPADTEHPGDIVLIPDPGYGTYTAGARFAGGEPYYLPLLPERDFLPDFTSIPQDVLRRARLMWLNYPNNPTTAVASLEFLSEAVEFARQHELLLCHDAVYSQVTFEGYIAPSLLQVPGAKDVAVEFNSLSKSHNMAGWRVGAALGNRHVLQTLLRLKTNADSGHFLPVLQAAIQAMTGDQSWLIERNEIYRQRRDIVIAGLSLVGLKPAIPQASLYVWSPVPAGYSSTSFAAELLEQAGVSVTPGVVFGAHGEGFIRIALAAPTGRVVEAMERITRIMEYSHASALSYRG
jgi:LL-diaminopimelate aminotransferase